MCCGTQKSWLLGWWILQIINLIFFMYNCVNNSNWLEKQHWSPWIKDSLAPGLKTPYDNTEFEDHRYQIGIYLKSEIKNGDNVATYRIVSQQFEDPYSVYWTASLISANLAIIFSAIGCFPLIPFAFCLAGCPICEVKKQKKVYRKFRYVCQACAILTFLFMTSTFVLFGIGVDNPRTKGQVYLDYSLYCGDPKPFQPDLCTFGVGFYKLLAAVIIQCLIACLSLVECFKNIEPIRSEPRAKSMIWDKFNSDDPRIQFIIERYQNMQQRMSRMSVAVRSYSVRRESNIFGNTGNHRYHFDAADEPVSFDAPMDQSAL